MTSVDGDQVVEIGNHAANMPGLACSLFAILATVLSERSPDNILRANLEFEF